MNVIIYKVINMKEFKFLTHKPITWKPLLYEQMVMAIIKNQHRNNFHIIGSRHTFWDNDFHFFLEITNIEERNLFKKVYYEICCLTQSDDVQRYDFVITHKTFKNYIDG